MNLKLDSGGSQTGFSLVELIIVILVIGIMSAYAMMRTISPREMTLPSQAQTMANDIRHVQALATTSGRRMRIAFDSGGYSVSCSDGATPCPAFRVDLQNGVALTTIDVSPLDFNSLGAPLNGSSGQAITTAANYTLSSGGGAKTVSIAAITGFVANP